jgi:hypothetical protein
VAILAALVVLMLSFGRKESAETAVAISSATNSALPRVAVPRYPALPPPPENKEQQMRQGLAELNNEDIVLYGRVVDQYSSPVPGAAINGTIQVNDGTRVGADKISMVTDANGIFTVSGYKGKALGIWVTKPGYVMATTNTRFVYSLLWPASDRYIPDANNPAVIKMWKLQGAEPLVNINQDFKLPYTNAPINFDLVAGKVVLDGGDITIELFFKSLSESW